MAKRKSVDLSKKHDREEAERLEESGDLYNELLGEWRIVPNLSDFDGIIPVRGNAQHGPAAIIAIENHPYYGKDGGDFSSRISIVAGLQGHNLHESAKIERIDPGLDAAGVYITQRGDTQTPWDLASPIGQHSEEWDYGVTGKRKDIGKGMTYEASSDVTLFADTIQLAARSGGVNIYAGGVGKTLSNGLPNETFVGVNLIGANRIDDYNPQRTVDDTDNDYKIPTYSLQPLVKGHSLQRYLNRMQRQIGDKANDKFSKEIGNTITKITDIAALFAGVFSAGAGAVKAATTVAEVPLIINVLGQSATDMYNSTIAEINASPVFSDSYLSRWNKTN
tara:strand:+ start:304 stop:1308 length:1005 start_codon:yes stop_codon:yes gene_type:complete